ncbi:3'-5' exonuclease [Microbispora corallina]|uniref:3'-5' exonuclease n=1 Tax=Microbispora corallina TaxID=83302 RepID=A0ABQ4GBI0_9ACTN|nr:exonuclease domain-containing protein [Microbispora corallina]GIH44450.1 3'-5' exonuclease [Microbispora corallina]
MTWLTGHWAGFDLETTGVSVDDDRVVTACIARVDTSGSQPPAVRSALADPGIEIPEAATEVHGISTEHARRHGAPAAEVVAQVADALMAAVYEGLPIVGFNLQYDVTLLDRETRRYGLEPFGDRLVAACGVVIDGYVLHKYADPFRKGSRKLTAVCEHYGVRLDGAHDSHQDALAAARVVFRIGQYAQKGVDWLREQGFKDDVARRLAGLASLDLPALHGLQVRAKAEQAASFISYLKRQRKPYGDVRGEWPCVPFEPVRQEALA